MLYFLIPNELLYDLSQFKFDGEGDTSIAKHASLFLKFCEHYEIEWKDVACVIFFLILKSWVNQWCHTLPSSSIHYFQHFIKERHLAFDKYDHWDVLKRINQLRINHDELVEDFTNRFLRICYEFPKEDTDWDLFNQNFEHLVQVSFHGEFKPPDVYTSPTFVNHEITIIS